MLSSGFIVKYLGYVFIILSYQGQMTDDAASARAATEWLLKNVTYSEPKRYRSFGADNSTRESKFRYPYITAIHTRFATIPQVWLSNTWTKINNRGRLLSNVWLTSPFLLIICISVISLHAVGFRGKRDGVCVVSDVTDFSIQMALNAQHATPTAKWLSVKTKDAGMWFCSDALRRAQRLQVWD